MYSTKQRHLLRQAQLHLTSKATSLAEVDEVLEGEGKGNGLAEGDVDIIVWLLSVGVRTNGDAATANVALAREADAIFGGFDTDCAKCSVLLV